MLLFEPLLDALSAVDATWPSLTKGGANDEGMRAKVVVPARLPKTPRAVAMAVRELSGWGKTGEAAAVARSSLFPWAADGEHELLREAFALLAHSELPEDVVAAIAAVAFTVRGEVLGAEWWIRKSHAASLAQR